MHIEMEFAKPEIGALVVVKKPRFMPLSLARVLDKHAGSEGRIVSVEEGKYSKELLCGVLFDTKVGSASSTGVYFADQLEFAADFGTA